MRQTQISLSTFWKKGPKDLSMILYNIPSKNQIETLYDTLICYCTFIWYVLNKPDRTPYKLSTMTANFRPQPDPQMQMQRRIKWVELFKLSPLKAEAPTTCEPQAAGWAVAAVSKLHLNDTWSRVMCCFCWCVFLFCFSFRWNITDGLLMQSVSRWLVLLV